MKKTGTITILLILAVAVVLSAALMKDDGKAAYYTALDEALAAAKPDQLVVAKFETDWCIWCKVMDTGVFAKPQAIDFFKNDMVLAKIDAEKDTVVAQKYSVSGYPTSVLMDKNGNEIDRILGYYPADEYIQMLKDYSHGIGTLEDLLSKAEENKDRSLFLEIAEKYKYSGRPAKAENWYGRVIEAGEPHDSLSGTCRIAIADMYRRAKEYDRSLAAFNQIAEEFKTGMFAEQAEIYRGIVLSAKGDTAEAIAAFEEFTVDFPESEDVEYANDQIDKLKKINKQGI